MQRYQFLRRRSRSRGVVLVVALIMLAVIGVSSAMAMRMSLFSDLVSKNMRSQSQALQSAELALRYCERQIALDPGSIPMITGPGTTLEWHTQEANWENPELVVTIPQEMLGYEVGYRAAPQCLVRLFSVDEYLAERPPRPDTVSADSRGFSSDFVILHRITARGYSPDFVRGDDGQAVAGAEVWLQSLVRGVQ